MDDLAPPPAYSAHDPHPRVANTSSVPTCASTRAGSHGTVPYLDPNGTASTLNQEQQANKVNFKGDKHKASRDASLGQPLYEAVYQRDPETVETLLQNFADTNYRPSGSKPALTKAVSNYDIGIVRLLLEEGNPDLEAYPSGGKTALYTAVEDGSAELVHLLLRYGANPNFKPSGGQPALYKAYSKRYREILWMLLDSEGIDIDAKPPGGSTTLYQAAEKGDMEAVRALLSAGATVDSKPSGGVSAMHRAAVRGDLATTDVLLQCGAKVDVTPPGGSTALWHATNKGNSEMVRLLLRYGADVNATRPGGQTVLTQAVKSDKSKDRIILNMLLESQRVRGLTGTSKVVGQKD